MSKIRVFWKEPRVAPNCFHKVSHWCWVVYLVAYLHEILSHNRKKYGSHVIGRRRFAAAGIFSRSGLRVCVRVRGYQAGRLRLLTHMPAVACRVYRNLSPWC